MPLSSVQLSLLIAIILAIPILHSEPKAIAASPLNGSNLADEALGRLLLQLTPSLPDTLAVSANGVPASLPIELFPGSFLEGFPLVGSFAQQEPLAQGSNLTVSPELYNLRAGSGTVLMNAASNHGGLSTWIQFANASPRVPGVAGYPNVRYGFNPFCGDPISGSCSSALSGRLALPMQVALLPDIWASVSYTTEAGLGPATPFDLAFDLWLTHDRYARTVGPGDVELMIWLYSSSPAIQPPDLPGRPPLLVQFPSSPVGPAGNSVYRGTQWVGRGGWDIAFLTPANSPSHATDAWVDLSAALASLPWVLGAGTAGTGMDSLYLEGISLGSEFLLPMSGGPASYGWQLSSYSLLVGTQPESYTVMGESSLAEWTGLVGNWNQVLTGLIPSEGSSQVAASVRPL